MAYRAADPEKAQDLGLYSEAHTDILVFGILPAPHYHI